MTQDDINQSEWEKSENWTAGSKWLRVYFSHADSRTVVPKFNPAHGWTLNFAKPGAVACLIASILGIILIGLLISVLIVVLET